MPATDNASVTRPERPALIHLERLSVVYDRYTALRDVSLDIGENIVTALIGPSGCGKTTLLRSLNRMNDLIEGAHVTGCVRIGGQDIYAADVDPVSLRKQVGMVFQKSNPFPKSIFDNVAYGPRLQGIRDRSELDDIVESSLRAAALWEEVKDRLDKRALALSGGQQQRLCIARTIAIKPRVLLMDEPASALDPTATAKIEELILSLKRDYTILVVTHNMQQAARISDETAFFYQGELVERDNTANIFTKPARKETEDYVTGRFG